MLLSDMLLQKDNERVAIATQRETVTYREFDAAVAGFAAHLHEMGVAKGDRVALWGYNSVNWLVAFFAIVRAGGVATLVNYSLSVDETASLLRDVQARFVVLGDNGQTRSRDDVVDALSYAAEIELDHFVDARASVCNLVQSYASAEGLPEQRTANEDTDTAFIIFTSGTTSRPKAVCISQRALTMDAHALTTGLGDAMGTSVCVAVPTFHILGLLVSFVYLSHGATVCLPANYHAEALSQIISVHEVSDMVAVGAIYQRLSEAKDFTTQVVPYLQLCLIAGGMSTPVQMMRLELVFAHATFINMYGLSEGAPLTMVRPSDLVEQRAQTVGRPVEGVSLRILGEGNSTRLAGEVGEVLARGACLMNGYEGLPPEEQPIDADGWLHTGDLGYLDEDGYLHLAGRLKDVIIRGGENISPTEIEAEISRIKGVRDVKVMGAPHPIFGESIEACVAMEEGATFDAKRILRTLRARIPRFKVPTHVFGFESFPLNVNGKIDQRMLFASMIGRLRELEVDQELSGGITVFDLKVKNTAYAIEPVTAMVDHLATAVGFKSERSDRICLAVEEMLTERIMDAYSSVGSDIRVRVALMPEWLRVAFSDNGTEYIIDKRRDTSMSANIILRSVDNFHTEYRRGKPTYCMDFLYDGYVDIKGFLLKNKETAE